MGNCVKLPYNTGVVLSLMPSASCMLLNRQNVRPKGDTGSDIFILICAPFLILGLNILKLYEAGACSGEAQVRGNE